MYQNSSLGRWLAASALYLGLLGGSHAGWAPGADFASARLLHTSTLLPDGSVWLAGGQDGSGGVLASTQRLDPGSGRWVAAANLPQPRLAHTSTRLRNGTVLIAGGTSTTGGPLGSAFIYDAQADAFTPAGADMAVRRRHHTATLLQDGRVLVVGGQGMAGQAALRSAEIYDPATRTWTGIDEMPGSGARQHTATLLANGQVLVAGGTDNHENPTLAAFVFNPASGAWQSVPMPAGQQRRGHTATLLPDGRVYLAGGLDSAGPRRDSLIFDPASRAWTQGPELNVPRGEHHATLMPDGRVLLTGGTGRGPNGPIHLASAEAFDPQANTHMGEGSMGAGRSHHTATLLAGGELLVAGGGDAMASVELFTQTQAPVSVAALTATSGSRRATPLGDGSVLVAGGIRNNVEAVPPVRYLPSSNQWLPAGTPVATGLRASHTQTLLRDGQVLAVGGYGDGGVTLGSAELYDPVGNTWSAAAALTQLRQLHSATLLADGSVLVAGGMTAFNPSTALGHAEIYRATDRTWETAAPLLAPRSAQAAVPLPGNRVLVIGGQSAQGAGMASVERYDAGTNTWTAVAPMAQPRRWGHTATLLHSGRVLVSGGDDGTYRGAELYDPATDTWQPAGTMVNRRSFHTATLLADGRVLVAGGYAGPANAAVQRHMEIYDPVSNRWEDAGSLNQDRAGGHTATLLPNGQVLVVGSALVSVPPGDSEPPLLITPSPQAAGRQRPAIAAIQGARRAGVPLQLQGSGFLGDSEGGSGATQQSASNLPVLRLERLGGGPALWVAAAQSDATSLVSLPLPGWLPDGPYSVRVVTGGVASVAYTLLMPADGDPPGMPMSLSAQPGDGQVAITWQAPSGSPVPVSYMVTAQPGGAACTAQHPATTCTVRNLVNGTVYSFTATAVALDGSTSAPSAPVTATPAESIPPVGAPGVPTGLAAQAGDRQVTLRWQAPAGNPVPTSYSVTAQPGGGGCTAQHPSTTCTVPGLNNGTAYAFTVNATAASGTSAPSPQVTATPRAAGPGPNPDPGHPGNLRAVPALGVPALAFLAFGAGALGALRLRRRA